MELRSSRISFSVAVLLSCFYTYLGTATDTITASRSIRDPETIISNGSAFKLGFFNPGNSSNRYVGIWYNKKSEPVVWVANRNKPLKDASGVVTVSEDGNLVVLNGQNEILWSSNVSNSVTNVSAQLLDTGNLVLHDKTNGTSIWESFQEPTNTFLQGMKLSSHMRTGPIVQLTSWKSPSDPSPGSFSFGIESSNIPEAIIWKDSRVHGRTGPWDGQVFIGLPQMYSIYLDGFKLLVDDQARVVTFTFSFLNSTVFFILTSQGIIEERNWVAEENNWKVTFRSLETECDIYGWCGAFGNCNPQKNPMCSCLRGFEPKNMEEWSRGNWSSGCVRKKLLQCERINQTGKVAKEDEFLKLETMKLPDFAVRSSVTLESCREQCLNNCSCIAYAYVVGIGCMTWMGSLIDLNKFPSEGADLYIRLAHSELEKEDNKVVVIVPVVVAIITSAICTFFLCRWLAKRKALKKKRTVVKLDTADACTKFCGKNLNDVELQDLPLFNFEKLADATNNFHLTNKLGQGGFGPVYRGELQDGQVIAVKRLSKASGQGFEEFKNEMMVISKLQHRNLVRLLGCCIDKEEKMLIYEYMPNKSLDAFLFDPLKQELLNWRKRFNIIEGISRGLIYLHRDSRMRIIHRDLKPSNILLDKKLNPKISDFGMARIFGGNEDQANTIRVVGTYGYMSPEYIIEGRFSEKSDVFSFGVLLLEIVSGKRNTGFYHEERSLSLLGYAWKLWNENNIVALIDPVISHPCFQSEISRCIHVGLLCVQEFVKDRPTMSTVISMLNSEIVDLPTPKQPAFTERRNAVEESSEQSQKRCSVNYVTVTVTEAR
ncbi:hypothetical protein ACOSQ2_027298 [Xanthoceras sorbifolium]